MSEFYNPFLVLLSVFIGVFSTYTAFILAERMSEKKRLNKAGWIYIISIIFGMGFFSMHFMGVMAERNHPEYTYDPVLLCLSLISVVMASFFAFSMLFLTAVSKTKIILSSFIMGLGLSSFHYIATLAMRQAVIIHITSFSFLLSIVISILFSFISLTILLQIKQDRKMYRFKYVISSILLGSTKFMIHVIGTKSSSILPNHTPDSNGIELFGLALYTSIFTLLLMVFAICLAFFDYRQLASERRLLQKIKESEEHYRRLVENSPEAMIVHDGEKIIFVNERCLEAVRATDKNVLIGKQIMNFVLPEYRDTVKSRLQMFSEGEIVKSAEIKIMTLDGATIDVEISGIGILYDHRPAIQIILRDITERKKVRRELEINRQRFQSLFVHNPDGVYSLDRRGFFREINPFGTRLLGYSKEELLSMPFKRIIDPKDLNKATEMFSKTLEGQPQNDEIHVIHKSGERIPIYITEIPIIVDNEILGVYGIAKDISKDKDAQKRMKELAYNDQLTQLPNRTWFYKELEHVIKKAKEKKSFVALLLIDFDNFKNINDTLGHHTGDLFLKKVAARLKDSIRKEDMIARMGGDEFILVQENVTEEEVKRMAEFILDKMSKPILINGHEIVTTMSIGISLLNACTSDFETLLTHADFAMYAAKEKGKNNYQFFTDDLNEKVIRKHQLEKALSVAIDNHEFRLYYQPQIDIQTGHLVGLEALLRWNPSFGFVSPAEFIPVAEETGLIVPIGEWVIREACRQVVKWEKQGYPKVRVSVNASARQFRDIDFAKKVLEIVDEEKMNPHYLEIEITETVMLNVKDSQSIIKELKKNGIKIAIDDFGTGYSSLNIISTIEFDTLKIDKSLIDDIHNSRRMFILNAVLSASKGGEMQIVIEGIETQEQLEYLKQFQVIGQGYYFDRPSPPGALEKYWKH
ncbi:EAL domain-containing protein [Niallia oryzisoli]|uniref:bifunctional diguanylate cyclase/phosphodiesterase n=1 Tax=Niallia oryzisoli TaxID=1737571 RepID=UPI00373555FA